VPVNRPNPAQLPLDGMGVLTDPPPTAAACDLADGGGSNPPTHVLTLPNWSTAWEVRTGRGGWPKINPKTGKVIRHRAVWEPLQGNARNPHWSARAKATRTVIDTVVRVATRAGMRACRHLTIQLVWAPGDMRRADRGNLMALQKACLDALARGRSDIPGLRLVPDDSDRWVEELVPRIARPPQPPGLWLQLWVR
jgi:hypothetical protein